MLFILHNTSFGRFEIFYHQSSPKYFLFVFCDRPQHVAGFISKIKFCLLRLYLHFLLYCKQRGWITLGLTVSCIGLYTQTEYSRKYLVPSIVLNMISKNLISMCWLEFCYEISSCMSIYQNISILSIIFQVATIILVDNNSLEERNSKFILLFPTYQIETRS